MPSIMCVCVLGGALLILEATYFGCVMPTPLPNDLKSFEWVPEQEKALQQRKILIIKWTRCVLQMSISLFPQPLCHFPVGSQSAQDDRDVDYVGIQEHGLPLTKAHLAMTTTECPISQQQRPVLNSQYGTIL